VISFEAFDRASRGYNIYNILTRVVVNLILLSDEAPVLSRVSRAFLIHICNRDPVSLFLLTAESLRGRTPVHVFRLSLRRALQLCRFVVSQEAAHVCVKQCLLCHVCVAEVLLRSHCVACASSLFFLFFLFYDSLSRNGRRLV